MRDTTPQKLARRKRRIRKRLRLRHWRPQAKPVLTAHNVHYELADRTQAVGCGGIGAIHLLARNTGLIETLDRNIHLLKVHLPYHESDHVLNIAYNVVADGTCLEDLELRRNDEAYLNALGASRIPDPTTAGDFCRRFESDGQVLMLMETVNQVRLGIWKQQAHGSSGRR